MCFLYATSFTKMLFPTTCTSLKSQFTWNLWAEWSNRQPNSLCTVLLTQWKSNCDCALCAENMGVNRKRGNPDPATMVLTWGCKGHEYKNCSRQSRGGACELAEYIIHISDLRRSGKASLNWTHFYWNLMSIPGKVGQSSVHMMGIQPIPVLELLVTMLQGHLYSNWG